MSVNRYWAISLSLLVALLLNIAADFRRVREDQEGPVTHHAAHAGGQERGFILSWPKFAKICLDSEVELRKFEHVTSGRAEKVFTLAVLHRLDGAFRR